MLVRLRGRRQLRFDLPIFRRLEFAVVKQLRRQPRKQRRRSVAKFKKRRCAVAAILCELPEDGPCDILMSLVSIRGSIYALELATIPAEH